MRPRTREAIVGLVAMLVMLPTTTAAQEAPYFLGAVAGSSQLSGDPSSNVTSDGFATSMYHAHTGPAVNVLLRRSSVGVRHAPGQLHRGTRTT